MKLKLDFRPSIIKVLVPLLLIGGTQTGYTDFGYILYQILWVPFSYFLRIRPFVDPDRSYMTTMWGILLAAVAWSIIFYTILSVKICRSNRRGNNPV
jgi:hypothetical protein